ncbi:cobalt ABC transporter permease [Leucothrix sargassi]|nr:cobalt ABC transporter permease [Leucothrix sargassi]
MKRVLLSSFLMLTSMSGALAHNVVSGVYAEGMMIEGEIGFSNGDMAPAGVTVEVLDKAGNAISTTVTEEGGVFSYQATSVSDYTFKADLGAGHLAEMTLEAEELSGGEVMPNESSAAAATETSPNTANNVVVSSGVSVSSEELQAMVRSAVAQQIRPLQKEIRAYKEKVFFRDITGGLGFIFGLFGVGAWVASRRKGA